MTDRPMLANLFSWVSLCFIIARSYINLALRKTRRRGQGQRVYWCGTDYHEARAGFNRLSLDLLRGPEHRHCSQGNRQNAIKICMGPCHIIHILRLSAYNHRSSLDSIRTIAGLSRWSVRLS
jgi:hypothetical protein